MELSVSKRICSLLALRDRLDMVHLNNYDAAATSTYIWYVGASCAKECASSLKRVTHILRDFAEVAEKFHVRSSESKSQRSTDNNGEGCFVGSNETIGRNSANRENSHIDAFANSLYENDNEDEASVVVSTNSFDAADRELDEILQNVRYRTSNERQCPNVSTVYVSSIAKEYNTLRIRYSDLYDNVRNVALSCGCDKHIRPVRSEEDSSNELTDEIIARSSNDVEFWSMDYSANDANANDNVSRSAASSIDNLCSKCGLTTMCDKICFDRNNDYFDVTIGTTNRRDNGRVDRDDDVSFMSSETRTAYRKFAVRFFETSLEMLNELYRASSSLHDYFEDYALALERRLRVVRTPQSSRSTVNDESIFQNGDMLTKSWLLSRLSDEYARSLFFQLYEYSRAFEVQRRSVDTILDANVNRAVLLLSDKSPSSSSNRDLRRTVLLESLGLANTLDSLSCTEEGLSILRNVRDVAADLRTHPFERSNVETFAKRCANAIKLIISFRATKLYEIASTRVANGRWVDDDNNNKSNDENGGDTRRINDLLRSAFQRCEFLKRNEYDVPLVLTPEFNVTYIDIERSLTSTNDASWSLLSAETRVSNVNGLNAWNLYLFGPNDTVVDDCEYASNGLRIDFCNERFRLNENDRGYSYPVTYLERVEYGALYRAATILGSNVDNKDAYYRAFERLERHVRDVTNRCVDVDSTIKEWNDRSIRSETESSSVPTLLPELTLRRGDDRSDNVAQSVRRLLQHIETTLLALSNDETFRVALANSSDVRRTYDTVNQMICTENSNGDENNFDDDIESWVRRAHELYANVDELQRLVRQYVHVA